MTFVAWPAGTRPVPLCNCTDGHTLPSFHCPGGAAGTGIPTYLSWASKPTGPWSKPVQLFQNVSAHTLAMDTNLAIVIFEDGSVAGIGRTGGQAGFAGIVVHRVWATNWRDPSSYAGDWDTFLFPNRTLVPDAGVEDPSLWIDPANSSVLHAVFHNQIEKDDERLSGGHAYSEDRGQSWTFTGTSWGNRVEFLASTALQLPASSFIFSRE